MLVVVVICCRKIEELCGCVCLSKRVRVRLGGETSYPKEGSTPLYERKIEGFRVNSAPEFAPNHLLPKI